MKIDDLNNVLYLDTSAFLKILIEEQFSVDLRVALHAQKIWSSALLGVEAHRAALRLGISPAEVDLRLAVVTFIAPTEASYFSARSVGLPELRTLDAMHLSAALELGQDLDGVVTYDRRLAAGCHHHDIGVVSPGRPPTWWVT